jgi:rhomboid family GlyGly-CTERM serine protease
MPVKIITNERGGHSAKQPLSWRQSLNCDRGYGWALLALLALLLLCAAGGAPWLLALRYERASILRGEWWRLLSAHFVHLGMTHLLLDGSALLLLWALYARALSTRAWLLVALGSMAAIDAGLWWLVPQLQWFVGISGLLHGVWAAGAVQGARRREISGWLLLAVLAAKLAREQYTGASLVVDSFPVVPAAHLYGALGALATLAVLVGLTRWRRPA